MLEFIGILFLLVGTILMFIPSQRKRKAFLFPLLSGLAIVYLHTLGPLAGKRQKLKAVLSMESTLIIEIHVYPYNDNMNKINLVKADMLINEQIVINKFSNALNKGLISDDHNQNPLWACYVEILKKDRSITRLEISKQGSETLIRPVTRGPSRWYYGTIRADQVGILLEQVSGILKY